MRTAFITGAARNLGRDIAEKLAAQGHNVVINSRNPEACEEVAKAIRDNGGKAIAAAADVQDEQAIGAAIDKAEAEFGGIDIVVHTAGIRAHGTFEEMTDQMWADVMNTNVMGLVYCLRRILPGMKERGWGRIIPIAGVSGEKGASNRTPVVVAKSGLIGFTKALALETANDGITVNAISPALINTARPAALGDNESLQAHYKQSAANIPVGRMGKMEEVSAAALYLCADEAAFVTGQVLRVNGGGYM
jgi:NAD(P)-dependent dehydrogenase (short-subunit alcohol dehydrogenase family)